MPVGFSRCRSNSAGLSRPIASEPSYMSVLQQQRVSSERRLKVCEPGRYEQRIVRTDSSVPTDQTQHTTVLVTSNPAVAGLSAHSDGGADGGGGGWGAALRPATHLLPGTVDPFICHAKAAGLADRHGIRLAQTTGHSELGACWAGSRSGRLGCRLESLVLRQRAHSASAFGSSSRHQCALPLREVG